MKIWSMWFQGRAQAPELCRRVFDLWERMNPEHKLHVVESEEARAIVEAGGVNYEQLPLEKIANLVRIELLAREGGMWVDATVVPTRPLDDWFFGSLDHAGFFAFRSEKRDRVLGNWLLWSEPGNPLAVAWRDALFAYYRERRIELSLGRYRRQTYWRCRRPGEFLAALTALRVARDPLWHVDRDRGWANPFTPYFAMHYLFAETIRRDPALARLWEAVPARASDLPHLVQNTYRAIGGGPRWEMLVDELMDHAPVHKLCHKSGDFRVALDRAEALAAGAAETVLAAASR